MEERRKRLLFAAKRRGTKEAEDLLGEFAERRVPTMSERDLEDFEALLAHPDRDVLSWIFGGKPAPLELDGPVLRALRSCKPHVQ